MSDFPRNLSLARDLALDINGDLILSASGDLEFVTGLEALQQEILFRLKTYRGDYRLQPDCGASLNTLIGQPLSPETAARAESLVIYALTHDNFLTQASVTVDTDPGPLGSTTLTLLIQIDLSQNFTQGSLPPGGSLLAIPIQVDLKEGLLL